LGAGEGSGFAGAVAAMLACRGRTIVMGMGKSGHVGRKIAATLASTGTPAFFVHPAEASHGDLGMVQPGDVVLAISNSGESDELAAVLPALRRLGVTLVAMTGKAESTLARHADLVLDSAVAQEACPLNLAPTASTTAQMALGDALAVALLDARGFRAEDFARSHPGGALGRRLLVLVADLMVRGDALPTVPPGTPFIDMMRTMSAKGLGAALVVDADGRLLGIFTDGDLRRQVERGADLRALTAGQVMHPEPKRIGPEALAVEGAELMEQHRITAVAVVDGDGRLAGLLTIGDLMRAKVV
jgi:arabinose-5-phosphate isomerase